MRSPQKREVASHLKQAHGLKLSHYCALVGLSRSTAYYTGTRPDDQRVRDRLREPTRSHRCYGYLRIHYLLRKEGLVLNPKRTYRLYREEGLQVYQRKGRKRLRGERVPLKPADRMNRRWSLDFVSDSLCSGRRFRTLNVGDDFSGSIVAYYLTSASPANGWPAIWMSWENSLGIRRRLSWTMVRNEQARQCFLVGSWA